MRSEYGDAPRMPMSTRTAIPTEEERRNNMLFQQKLTNLHSLLDSLDRLDTPRDAKVDSEFETVNQIVIPAIYTMSIIEIAHQSQFSGYLGVCKTYELNYYTKTGKTYL